MNRSIFNIKKVLVLFVFIFLGISYFYCNEEDKTLSKEEKMEKYRNERITFEIKKKFDVLYPMNTKIFYFQKGDETLNFKEFLELTQDSVLLKNQKKLKRIKIAGFSVAGVFGGASLLFMVPAIVFIANQTNYNKIANEYTITGIVCVALSGACLIGVIIDLVVTFTLLYKFKYSEYAVRQAVERYNEALQKRLGIVPDISFNQSNIDLSFGYVF
jgi:hypothetical protein